MHQHEESFSKLVNINYLKQGFQNENAVETLLQSVLQNKKMPAIGWNDQTIETVLNQLSMIDSNNFLSNIGLGEREGRVYSSIVLKRHFYFSHGIGRSGDISEVQPKAAGSSLLYKLTDILVSHALEIAGYKNSQNILILPLATGMTLSMCLLTLKSNNSNESSMKYVIWPRIDQKSCFKCIPTAGLIPLIVDNIINDDGIMQTDLKTIRNLLILHRDEVLGVLSTTSCFAPRQPDLVDEIAKLCQEFNVAHVINNAYGLQCNYITKLINRASVIGRVDAGKVFFLYFLVFYTSKY
jgi:O-phospho-L-seryl-tRNASec:L-selenocysteinyl-tRNA synthase